MSQINYDDFQFSSEDDNHKDEHSIDEESTCMELEEDDEIGPQNVDIDEYLSFSTDLEKHTCDQLRWDGISNTRRYDIAKRNTKTKQEGEGQLQSGAEEAEKPARNSIPDKQALTKLKNKRKFKGEDSSDEETEEDLQLGEIHFDVSGDLWYTHQEGGVYLSGKL